MAGERSAGGRAGAGGLGGGAGSSAINGYLALENRDADAAFDREQYQQLSAGLASLDVRLPERGNLYRFTTPRGKVEIAARAVSRATLSKLVVLGLLLTAGAIGWCVNQPAARGVLAGLANSLAGAGALIFVGLASVVSGILPVAGILLAGVGLFLVVRAWVIRTSPQSLNAR
jgi:hypothetical protein